MTAQTPDAPEGGLIIDLIGGNCPVQAEGTVDGYAFYFRARGERWQFHVAPDDALIFSDQEVFYLEEPYGDGPFDAGWMEVHEAEAFIRKAADAFRAALTKARGPQ